jgi:hypothetical protein
MSTTGRPTQSGKIARSWWKSKKGRAHEDVVGLVKYLRQHSRREYDIFHMRLYGNYDAAGQGWQKTVGTSLHRDASGRMRYNMVASIIDTAASLVASAKPMPMYLTSEGDFGLQRKARLRTRVIEGQFYDLGAYNLGPKVFYDGAVLGTGAVFGCVHPVTGKPHLERVMPLELSVDHTDAIAGKPRGIQRSRLMSREVLIALFPKLADKLATAGGPSGNDYEDWFLNRDSTADQVVVYEAWHLDSGGRSSDGRHIMCTDTCTIFDDSWDEDDFPFAFYRWKDRLAGFWGMGLAEAASDAQWRANQLIKRTDRLQDLGSNGFVFLEGSSEVTPQQIGNLPMQAIRYVGTPPTFYSHSATPPDLQQQLADIREQTLSEAGLSGQAISGEKPAGVTSGVGLRATDDIQSRRHIQNQRQYEGFYMSLAQLLERLNDQVAERDPSYEIQSVERRGRAEFLKSTKWKDLNIGGKDKSRIRMFPTSALPSTPQGKWSAVQEWIQAGFVSRPFAMQLLDFPDLDAATRIELADLDYAMWQVETMLDGDTVMPEPYQDLKLAGDIVRKSLLQAEIMGAGDDVLDLMRDFLDELKRMTAPAAPEVDQTSPLSVIGNGAVPTSPQPGSAQPAAPQMAA